MSKSAGRNILKALVASCVLGTTAASAAENSFMISHRGETTNLISRGGQLAIEVSSYALNKAFGGTGSVHSVHKVIMVGRNGGRGCTSFITADAGVSFTDRACVTFTKAASGVMDLSIRHAFQYPRAQRQDPDFKDATSASEVSLSVSRAANGGCRASVVGGYEVRVNGVRRPVVDRGAGCRVL